MITHEDTLFSDSFTSIDVRGLFTTCTCMSVKGLSVSAMEEEIPQNPALKTCLLHTAPLIGSQALSSALKIASPTRPGVAQPAGVGHHRNMGMCVKMRPFPLLAVLTNAGDIRHSSGEVCVTKTPLKRSTSTALSVTDNGPSDPRRRNEKQHSGCYGNLQRQGESTCWFG